ncbi:sensor domain-containing diguanylate cyclase [Paraburkholderia hospita]|uniref:sensor domain-containing diguanylate cyclase n=1 Tax=Paraburkholderia hospita TaxID=169430 RepID=UPI000B3422E6|nr:GGDEF domain-containing protein [Paraburkholderia hospita]OUL90461.1 sensor domain-containing diguanylate cyclase [Paraburkholderia hospita]
MAKVEVRKLVRKARVGESNLDVNALRRMFSRGELWQLTRVGLVGLVAAFVLLVISGQLKTMAGELVAIWIVDGYLPGHMMLLRRRYKPVFLAGAAVGLVLGNLMGDETFYVASSFTAAGIVETCAAALLLPEVKSAKELLRPRVFVRFLLSACVVASMLSGVVAVILLQGIFTTHPFSSFSNWVISDALGFLIFTPVTLVMLSGEWRTLLQPGNRIKSASLLALIGIVATVIFSSTTYDDLYWMLPPLALLAFRAEFSTVLLGTLIFITVSVPLTIHGTGPLWLFPFATMQDRILALQLFTVAALSIVLPITVLQTQRNSLLSALADGQRRFRNLAERSEEVLMELSADGAFQYVSPRASIVLGYEPGMLLGRSVLDLVHPDDRNELAAVLAQAWKIGVEESAQYRFRRADETHIWVRSFISAMPSGIPGGLMALAFAVLDVDAAVVAEQTRLTEERHLRDMAFIDSLTGLRNRRYLDSKVEELLNSPAHPTSARPVAVLFTDIDYFKNFNDEYGHQAGDECLKAVGQCIATTLRKRDLLARYGGEEFVIVLENCEQTEAAAAAELIRAAVESLGLGHRGSPLGVVTLSIGVAQGEMRRPSDAAELFELADSALYIAKRMGRNRVGRVQDAIAVGESASSSTVTSVARRHL